jgi:hypothetical protein
VFLWRREGDPGSEKKKWNNSKLGPELCPQLLLLGEESSPFTNGTFKITNVKVLHTD